MFFLGCVISGTSELSKQENDITQPQAIQSISNPQPFCNLFMTCLYILKERNINIMKPVFKCLHIITGGADSQFMCAELSIKHSRETVATCVNDVRDMLSALTCIRNPQQ